MSLESSIHIGLEMQRPDAYAALAGLYFYASDTQKLYLCDGTQWTLVPLTVVFGASGANHSLGLVPDAGSSAGTTRYLREDATWHAPPGSGGANVIGAYLQSDVALGAANHPVDVLTVAIPAGTWRVTAQVTVMPGSTRTDIRIRVWDGTTTYAETVIGRNYDRTMCSGHLSGIVTLAGLTNLSLNACDNDAGTVVVAAVPIAYYNGSGALVATNLFCS